MNFYDIKVNKVCIKFDFKKVRNILDQIEKHIKDNVGPMVSLINEDNSLFCENYSYTKLIETIDRINKEPWILENRSKHLLIDGIGNLGVIYNGNPEILVYLSLKALKTNNNIIFFQSDENRKINNYIINSINTILEKNNYKAVITIEEMENKKDITKYKNYLNTIICIGEIMEYNNLKELVKTDIIYSAYGTLSLYMDDKDLRNTLLDMDEYIFKNNLILDLYKDQDVKDVIQKINEKGESFCAVVFTKDIKKAYYFIENVDSQNVYVNKNPFKNYVFYIDDRKIVKIKNVII